MNNYRDHRHIEIRSTVNTREILIETAKNSQDILESVFIQYLLKI